MRCIAVFLVCAHIASAATDSLSPGLKVLGRVVEHCLGGQNSVGGCLEEEAGVALGRALEQDSITLVPGLTLTRSSPDPPALAAGRSANSLWENINRLASTRSLSISFNDAEEGRGKKKKRLLEYILVAALTMAAFLIPLKLKVIAVMAGSALFIGKIALVLAGLAGLKKLVGQPHEETTHVHYDNHRNDVASHYLAYGAHAN